MEAARQGRERSFTRSVKGRSGGFDEVWDAVEAGTPVLIGMTISDAFFMPDGDGVIDSDEPVDPARRHAVVAVATGERAGVKLPAGEK